MSEHEEVIRRIAWEVRLELENYYEWDGNPQAMVGLCRDASHELAKRLVSAGVDAEPYWCSFLNADPEYPEAVRLSGAIELGRDDDDEEFDGSWAHWVVVCGTTLIDITQDQFYPGQRDWERVVITNVKDRDYSLTEAGENRETSPSP